MLNRVMLRAVRRIVRYTDFQSKLITQLLQSLLEHIPIAGITTAAIAKYQQIQSLRIMLAAMLFPPMRNAVATKLAGIMAGIEVDITFVPSQIVDAMRNQSAFTRAGKIVIQSFHSSLGMRTALAGKIPNQLLFAWQFPPIEGLRIQSISQS